MTKASLLTALVLGACLMLPSGAHAATGSYSVHNWTVTGNGQAGPLRMAGKQTVSNPLTTPFSTRYSSRARHWGQQTQYQRRYNGGMYGNLNQ